MAGAGIGVAMFVDTNATLGISIPLLELFTSSMADTGGIDPSVLMPTPCALNCWKQMHMQSVKIILHMIILLMMLNELMLRWK